MNGVLLDLKTKCTSMELKNGTSIRETKQAVKSEHLESQKRRIINFEYNCPPCISNILLSVMLCTTLKPNGIEVSGNFFWLDTGLTNSENESNTLSGSVFI